MSWSSFDVDTEVNGEAEWRLILETHEENMRRGHLTRIFPREVQSCRLERGACAKQQTEHTEVYCYIDSWKIRCAELEYLCCFLVFDVTFVFDMRRGLQGSKQFLQRNFKCASRRAVASTVSSSPHLGANEAV